MNFTVHFLRPWYFLLLLPLLIFSWYWLRQRSGKNVWSLICDHNLLSALLVQGSKCKLPFAKILLLTSLLFIIISLTGPSWQRLPVPIYQRIHPKVVILDLSPAILAKDLSPDRLNRVNFKLHDLFKANPGQVGMIVYTAEPFVVSPLTDDASTIDSLLPTLTPDIMPVQGQKLDLALMEAKKLIKSAGFFSGDVLVLTGDPPQADAINVARKLAQENIFISVIPLTRNYNQPGWQEFVNAGKGYFLPYTHDSADILKWLQLCETNNFDLKEGDQIPQWRDEGRWFLLIALVFFLPIFRRGWFESIKQ